MKSISFAGILLAVFSVTVGCSGEDELSCGWHKRGQCGLWKKCVDCNTDADCDPGAFCSLYGECLDLPQCGNTADQTCPEGEACVQGKCEIECEADWDCMAGAGTCLPEGYCAFERCLPKGTCPPGFEPLDGSLVCGTACPEGLERAGCGFAGQCVECAGEGHCYHSEDLWASNCEYDSDCPYRLFCVNGVCSAAGTCTIHGECRPRCDPDKDECSPGETCVDGICAMECQTDQDCLREAGACHPDGYCVFEWCRGGYCREGWEPVEGTLACRLPCPPGMMPGKCGMRGQCIDCITDEDCEYAGATCMGDGSCATVDPCTADDQCPRGKVCLDSKCVYACTYHDDCMLGWRCNDRYCYRARCSPQGACPEGWEFLFSSLLCHYTGG